MILRIDEIAFGGRGVGRLEDGRVVFVPFVALGESVRVEIVREHRSYLEARLVEVVEASAQRVAAPCPYYGKCGGCSYQHLSGAEQRAVKQQQVAGALRRIGRFEEEIEVRATVSSPAEYGYRNRITVHARDGVIGFFAHAVDAAGNKGGREVLDIARCLIAEDDVNAELAQFRRRPPRDDGRFTLMATDNRQGFRQTNDGASAELLRIVSELLPPAAPHLIDAYCGAGFFARALRDRFQTVVGLEWDKRAVAAARTEAAAHEGYRCGDVAEMLADELARFDAADTTLILDPPAEGLAPAVRTIVQVQPPAEIVYVSCNPATLARDLGAWRDIYAIVSVTPLDMFPQTAEIEAVAHLRRRTPG